MELTATITDVRRSEGLVHVVVVFTRNGNSYTKEALTFPDDESTTNDGIRSAVSKLGNEMKGKFQVETSLESLIGEVVVL